LRLFDPILSDQSHWVRLVNVARSGKGGV
jgi:hypothetical protein